MGQDALHKPRKPLRRAPRPSVDPTGLLPPAAEAFDTVFVLGDSVVWGEYVLPDGTWSHFLDREAGVTNRFVNVGVNGLFPLALEGLVRFSAEEIKHQELFRRMEQMIGSEMPPGYRMVADPNDVARAVLAASSWSVLALTCHIELFTQVVTLRPNYLDAQQKLAEAQVTLLAHWVKLGAPDPRVNPLVSGVCPTNDLVELIELPDHPWFIAGQFHPELRSRATTPHPLFRDFVKASLEVPASIEEESVYGSQTRG